MSLKLGLDFGTATTCMATVRDRATFLPEVIPVTMDRSFESSAVFLDRPNASRPLVPSESACGRAPLDVFGQAEARFGRYWKERVATQRDGVKWERWQVDERREQALLLTYFKPELADHPVKRPVLVPRVRFGVYDALSQSDDVMIEFETREVSTPEPDTDDLIAATAAIMRVCVETAARRFNQQVSLLAIGLPSFSSDHDPQEVLRAKQRRILAVERAGIAQDFGTTDFRVDFVGEAQAAAYSIDVDPQQGPVYSVIVDVGAGTTDLAFVPYRRERGGRYVADEPLITASHRFAGRDLNHAVALALQIDRQFREGLELMDQLDRRAWQLLMDQEVEGIKRGLKPAEERFRIHLYELAAHVDGCPEHDRRTRILGRSPAWLLSTRSPEIRNAVDATCRGWRTLVTEFLDRVQREIGGGHLVSIELVGGAFRFDPFLRVMETARRNSGTHAPMRFRSDGDQAQTAVARGLARWAALH